jgi:hypothetical protein
MAYCPHCGAASTGSAFCGTCGKPMTLGGAVPAATSAPMAAAPAARPVGVTIIGVVVVVGSAAAAALLVIGAGLLLLGSAAAFSGFIQQFPMAGIPAALIGALFMVFAVLALALAAVGIVSGLALLRGKEWARWLVIVFQALSLLGALGNVAQRQFGSAVFSILVAGVVIWYLLQPDVKAWFEAQGRAA